MHWVSLFIDKNTAVYFDSFRIEYILIYDISYKTLINPKPLRIRFDKTDGFIRISDGTRYLTLIGSEKLFYLQQN